MSDTQCRKQKLLNGLAGFTGSETWYRHWTRRLIHTEGVQYLAKQAGAYWLVDLVASWCQHPAILGQDFVVWHLRVNDDRSAEACATDGNDGELVRQSLSFTDFPLAQIELYLTDNTLLLPSEY